MRTPVMAVALCLLAGSEIRAQEWIAFETIDQSALPIVRCKLNGMGGHRLVLDPGLNDFILDTTIVAGTGIELVSQGEITTIDYYGREEEVPVAYLQELTVGQVQIRMARALLVEGEDATGIGGIRSYGRIGRELLEPLRLTVHYPRRLLYLEPSPEDEIPEGGVSYRTAGRFLLVPVVLTSESGEKEVEFVLDPGTSASVIDKRWAQRMGFAEKDATSGTIPALEIGGFSSEKVPVLLGEMKELPYEGRPVGVIGADVLRRLSVTYDFARDRVWLMGVEEGPS